MSSLFTDPVAQVIITDKTSGEEWKWSADTHPFLVSLSINYERNRVKAFTFGVDIPYDIGVKLLGIPTPFKLGNRIKARIGYAGANRWTPWAYGMMIKAGAGIAVDANGVSGQVMVPGVAESFTYEAGSGGLKKIGRNYVDLLLFCMSNIGVDGEITLGADEKLFLAQEEEKKAKEEPKKKAKKKGKPSVNYFEFGPDDELFIIGSDDPPSEKKKSVRKKRDKAKAIAVSYFSEYSNKSYWDIIKDVCKDNGLSFLIRPEEGSEGRDKMIIHKASDFVDGKAADDPIVRTYKLRGILDESKNQYPCISWAPEGSEVAAWLAELPDPGAHGAKVTAIDAVSGEVKEVSQRPEDLDIPIEGVLAAVGNPEPAMLEWLSGDPIFNAGRSPEESPVRTVGIADDGDSTGHMQVVAESVVNQGSGAQKGSITSIGVPEEKTGNRCELVGCGAIYDHIYSIDKLTHSWAGGSWDMTLIVHRDGTSDKAGEQKQTRGGQVKK